MRLFIPYENHLGTECLSLGVPWMVRDSIYELDILLSSSDRVLEFGGGGSTIFFSHRCGGVLSFETDYGWWCLTGERMSSLGITNVHHYIARGDAGLGDVFKWCRGDLATVLSIDTVHGYNRSSLLSLGIEHCPNLRMIILDNYSSSELFPLHHFWGIEEFSVILGNDWHILDFNDIRWHGSGTRILVRDV